MGQLSSILKMCELKTIVYKMLCLTTLCWSSFAKTSRANALHISGVGMSPEESHSISIKASLTLNHNHKGFQESNTVLQQRTDKLVHVREKTTGRYSKKGRYRKGRSRITEGFKQRKRDYFFTPASSYDEMPGSVDRRMFLVHQEERGPCHFLACHHGGTCVARRHGFYCQCLPGFMGTRCEVKKECEPTTCKNGGTCTEIATGRHLCTCLVGYRGENCEERSYCHPNPCLNGGSCSQSDDSYICLCQLEYKGKNCEEINKCSPNPCKNSGVCFELMNDYVCNCPQGFKGKTCEVVSECNSVYCLNGGTCRDEPNGYSCDCRLGFNGKHCEASACFPNPCENDGSCLRFGNEYSCQCKPGFHGRRCEVKRTCSIGLCFNEGTCVDGSHTNSVYGFACICKEDYDGIFCEKSLLEAVV
ncbi:fibropellin-3-like isoform X2 [Acropora millepora]|uniref:fibropellin-3-like isoform X2 n=1 Tax=Acropora millepora TaxID=45264 RepID=UPI001CF4B7D9|nr:fibropellin-3-like isoform X2 [Acropora millepora]